MRPLCAAHQFFIMDLMAFDRSETNVFIVGKVGKTTSQKRKASDRSQHDKTESATGDNGKRARLASRDALEEPSSESRSKIARCETVSPPSKPSKMSKLNPATTLDATKPSKLKKSNTEDEKIEKQVKKKVPKRPSLGPPRGPMPRKPSIKTTTAGNAENPAKMFT